MKEFALKIFDYSDAPKALLTPDVVAMLTSIHEQMVQPLWAEWPIIGKRL
jgi:hypothetical protein